MSVSTYDQISDYEDHMNTVVRHYSNNSLRFQVIGSTLSKEGGFVDFDDLFFNRTRN